ncbi:MAG: MotA/TolQ/ExbB proton channel family protein [Candidatus Desantisbacteria bacterium]
MNLTQTLMDISLGGSNWILGLLIILSVLSIAVIIEKGVVYYQLDKKTKKLWDAMNKCAFRADGLSEVSKVLSDYPSPTAHIIKAGIEASHLGPDAMREVMGQEESIIRMNLEKRLAFLGTLGANAPFIGLFGTVLGIIRSFKDLAISGQGGESVIAGIAESLVATAMGLFVAIPAAIFYNVFKKKIHNMMVYADALAHMTLKIYYQGREQVEEGRK